MTAELYNQIDEMINKVIKACPLNESNLGNKLIIATLPNEIDGKGFNQTLDELNNMSKTHPRYTNLVAELKDVMYTMRDIHTKYPETEQFTSLHIAENIASVQGRKMMNR
ncbi:hypothetical protein NOVO_06465 [Rickettsiales bacterium Ac37b]|nr:hypothetical protein NOVO_06465 [Rickettsiales bacterium Ac37b]